MSSTPKERGFSGRRRARSTRPSVFVADRLARVVITIGGLGTILSVIGVCFFLGIKFLPLFYPESIALRAVVPIRGAPANESPLHMESDEYLSIAWSYFADGMVRVARLDNGESLQEFPLFPDKKPTAWSFSLRRGDAAFGFADGSLQLGKLTFETTFLPEAEITDRLRQMQRGAVATHERVVERSNDDGEGADGASDGEPRQERQKGVVFCTPEGQFRFQRFVATLDAPVVLKAGAELKLLDYSASYDGAEIKSQSVAALTSENELYIAQVTRKVNLNTGKVTTRARKGVAPVALPPSGFPDWVRFFGLGDTALLVWRDGRAQRYDCRSLAKIALVEELNLLPAGDRKVTQPQFLIGKTTLLVGDSAGDVGAWFLVKPEGAATGDGSTMVRAHHFPGDGSEVVKLAVSQRSRMFASGSKNGAVRLCHVTSNQLLGSDTLPAETAGAPLEALMIGPKDNAVLAYAAAKLSRWRVNAEHPETTLSSVFFPVWYEGSTEPVSDWQSSSGEDAFEPKYGIGPLVFGSLKATFYSMLFGAPLALLAAIYSSQFLHPSTRAKVKPTIEIMASLPSVVLGFLAALVFARIVERHVPETVALLAAGPFCVLLGAYLWQLLPITTAIRWRWLKLGAMLAPLGLAVYLAWRLGPWVEKLLFAGDTAAWLDGQIGTGAGAWLFLLLPLSALVVTALVTMFVTPLQRKRLREWSRFSFALVDLAKFLAASVAVVALAWLASALLAAIGWDPRGSSLYFVDTYVQRNALVVGIVMGFAVIPIIYTISDDALTAVPESLRAGSLGCGATEWQTAIRVVIPTAMSGLFSALMIGLGRAIGETMIVLMAAGNTPVWQANMFNGFRTLSANIAVELPEAPLDSTHFRMLFLTGFVLFAITFAVNTVAEIVRLRFRKRAFQL